MSTNKTQNYNLHAWALEDDFLTREINENFAALDAALKKEAAAAGQAVQAETEARSQQVAALNSTVGQKEAALNAAIGSLEGRKSELVAGAYTGDGAASRFVSLGFTPRALLVIQQDGKMGGFGYWGGLALLGLPARVDNTDRYPIVTITEGGFLVYYRASPDTYTNISDYVFHYLALK